MSRLYIIALLLIASASSVLAGAPVSVNEYVAVRKKLMTQLSLATLKSAPCSYVGKVFEIKGVLTGSLKQTDGTDAIVIISTSEGSYSVTTDIPPTETPGAQLACLLKIGEKSTLSLSDLRLIACTYLAELDPVRPPDDNPEESEKPSTVKTPLNPPRGAESRGNATSKQMTGEELVAVYKSAIRKFNSHLSDKQADTIARSIIGFSLRYKVDARLVCAVILAESHFRPNATSRAGAQGLGQLMPSTAAGLGVDNAYDPVQNIYGSVRYVKGMLDRMSGNKKWNELTWYDLSLALAAYNAGPGAVKKHGGVPPYKETQNYVARVTSIYKQLCGVK